MVCSHIVLIKSATGRARGLFPHGLLSDSPAKGCIKFSRFSRYVQLHAIAAAGFTKIDVHQKFDLSKHTYRKVLSLSMVQQLLHYSNSLDHLHAYLSLWSCSVALMAFESGHELHDVPETRILMGLTHAYTTLSEGTSYRRVRRTTYHEQLLHRA